MTFENYPSKVAAADQPFVHFHSNDAVGQHGLAAWVTPFTRKLAPGKVWKVARMLRSGSKSCAQARRPRRMTMPSAMAELTAAVSDVLGVVAERKSVGADDRLLHVGRHGFGACPIAVDPVTAYRRPMRVFQAMKDQA